MANYNTRLLDRKIVKKLKSTGGILLKGVRFCGKTTTALHHAASFVRLDEIGNHQRTSNAYASNRPSRHYASFT